MAAHSPAIRPDDAPAPTGLRWKDGPGWAVAAAVVALIAVLNLTRISEFLYFQF